MADPDEPNELTILIQLHYILCLMLWKKDAVTRGWQGWPVDDVQHLVVGRVVTRSPHRTLATVLFVCFANNQPTTNQQPTNNQQKTDQQLTNNQPKKNLKTAVSNSPVVVPVKGFKRFPAKIFQKIFKNILKKIFKNLLKKIFKNK